MKNLMIYINPERMFKEECRYNYDQMIKVQIDNSLDLNWKKEDILLVTNFHYEYNGVKSLVVSDDLFCDFDMTSTKVPVIKFLFDSGIIGDELYWYHDLDAYQNQVIEENELDVFHLGLTTYGYKIAWNCGCLYFKKPAEDTFNVWHSEVFRKRFRNRCDEKVLLSLTSNDHINQYKTLNHTYNFNFKYTYVSYESAIKPLKVLHFHPMEFPRGANNKLLDHTNLDVFMYGKNLTKLPFMSERLIRIFHDHNIR